MAFDQDQEGNHKHGWIYWDSQESKHPNHGCFFWIIYLLFWLIVFAIVGFLIFK